MDIARQSISLPEWSPIIEEHLSSDQPIVNLVDGGEGVYDAIFIGGGAAGRFGSAYLKALGGRPLVVDRWPFLGGSCPHQACVPHHLFSEAAAILDRERWLGGQLWFRDSGEVRASILDVVDVFRKGRVSAHAFMNWQTKTQLEVEYILNASARAIDPNTVEAVGRTFRARNVVIAIGAHQNQLDVPGADLPGVFDFGTLVEDLDYEPRTCVMTAARNIMGEPYEFDFSEYSDFLHTTYEMSWVGLTEDEARERHPNVVVIQMPPKGIAHEDIPLPVAEGTMLYAFLKPELSGFQKCVIDGDTRRVLGFHHVGYGAKDAFQYLDYLLRRPEGITIDEMGQMNELFLNPEHFIQLCRLRAGRRGLVDL